MSRRKQSSPSKIRGTSSLRGPNQKLERSQCCALSNGKSLRSVGLGSEMDTLAPVPPGLFEEGEPIEPHSISAKSLLNNISGSETKCKKCARIFLSKQGLLQHFAVFHEPTNGNEHNQDVDGTHLLNKQPITGFHDLSFIDFSCSKFPCISELICSDYLHRLTERDRKTFFLCKRCDRVFPTLSSLGLHFSKCDALTHNIGVDVIAQPPYRDPSGPCQNGNDGFKDLLQYLQLRGQGCDENADPSKLSDVDYAMNNEMVYTSPKIASLVPSWMCDDPNDICSTTQFEEESPGPSIKTMKDIDEELKIMNEYFFTDLPDDVGNGEALNPPPEADMGQLSIASCGKCGKIFTDATMLERHQAVSSCGIEVRRNKKGKKMYWCLLCNYASFEKSTLIRHQRTHTGVRPFLCKVCRLAFTTKANCERHIRKRHRNPSISDVDVKKLVYCDYELINKTREREEEGSNHVESGSGDGRNCRFNCRLCKEWFATRGSGERHAMLKHGVLDTGRISNVIVSMRPSPNQSRKTSMEEEEDAFPMRKSGSIMKPLPKQPPKLIPLLKIQAYHERAQQMAGCYEEEYDQMYSSLLQQSSSDVGGRVLSLIGSAMMLKRQEEDPSFLAPLSCTMDDFDFERRNTNVNKMTATPNGGIRSQYQMVLSQNRKNAKSSLKWRFVSTRPPRMRDERGRYVRNPNSPMKLKPPVTSRSRGDHQSLSVRAVGKTSSLHGNRNIMKRKKCPKCDKTFPWSSSLRRHIMIHSGVKPHECAHCNMKFITRSNMLRHVYRRHGSAPLPTNLPSMVVSGGTCPVDMMDTGGNMVDTGGDVALSNKDETVELPNTEEMNGDLAIATTREVIHFNKRYLCGMCRLPFANRSNVVRHLHRIHSVTKEHPNFRSLLVRINKDRRHELKCKQETGTLLDSDDKFPPVPGSIATVDSSLKAFTCAICGAGFTKRNNAARHIQNQHHLSRRSAGFHQFILRNEIPDSEKVVDEEKISTTKKSPPSPTHKTSLLTPADECDATTSLSSTLPTPDDVNEGLGVALKSEAEEPLKENQESSPKHRRRLSSKKMLEGATNLEVDRHIKALSMQKRKRDIRMSYFVCGVCKRVFKAVEELKEHLEVHNIAHPWHCPLCDVPFTNKFNCQRHIVRRHNDTTTRPKFVEDVRHGPRHPRKKSKGFGRR